MDYRTETSEPPVQGRKKANHSIQVLLAAIGVLLSFILTVGVLLACGKSGSDPDDDDEPRHTSRGKSGKRDKQDPEDGLSSGIFDKSKIDEERELRDLEARARALDEALTEWRSTLGADSWPEVLSCLESMTEIVDRKVNEVYHHFGQPYRPALLQFLTNIKSSTELKTDRKIDTNLVAKPKVEAEDEASSFSPSSATSAVVEVTEEQKAEDKKVFDPENNRVVLLYDEDKLRDMLAEICAEETDEDEDDYRIPENIDKQRAEIFMKLFERMIEPPEEVTYANREAFREAAAKKFAKAFAIFRKDVQTLTVEEVTDAVARELFLDALGLPRVMRQTDCKSYLGTITQKYLDSDLIPGLPVDDPEERQRLVRSFIYGRDDPRRLPVASMVIPIIRNVRIKEDLFRRMNKAGIARLESMTVTGGLGGRQLENDTEERLLAYTYELEMTASMDAIDAFINSLHQAYRSGIVYVISPEGFRLSASEDELKTANIIVADHLENANGKSADPHDPDYGRPLIGWTLDNVKCTLTVSYLYDDAGFGSGGGDQVRAGFSTIADGPVSEYLDDFAKDKSFRMETVFSEGIDTTVASKVFGKRFDTAPFGEKTNMMVPYPMAECVHCHVLIPVDAYPPVGAEEDGSCPVCGKPLSPRVKSEALQPKDDTNFNGISDEWEQQYALTDTSADSDQDGDGFTLKDEFEAKTDPTDPLSHPKYISYICVEKAEQARFPGLQLVSVDMSKPDKKDWDIKFNTQVLSGSSVSKKTPIVRIGRPLKNIDSKKKNVDFTVVDIGIDEKTHEPVVYIRRVANLDELIPCRKGKTVLDPQQKVYFKSSLATWGWEGSYNNGVEFKLGTEKTGEERYRFVSVDLETKEAVVESVGEPPETFTILPAPKDTAAGGTLPPGTIGSPFLRRQ